MVKKIIITGYPKSGNTWLARLTAELSDSPVRGFLYSDHKEIAVEGEERKGDFEIYKSHHQWNELTENDQESAKIIYIIRDPRDVAISGRTYFKKAGDFFKLKNARNLKGIQRFNRSFKGRLNKMVRQLTGNWLINKRMNQAVLYGNPIVHHWCRISWREHLAPYLKEPSVLKIQYESLLDNPELEGKRIVQFLGIGKKENEIRKSIENQSFKKVKEKAIKNNDLGKAKFLRAGKNEQWKDILTVSKKENMFGNLPMNSNHWI